MTQQQLNLVRVNANVVKFVMAFCLLHLRSGTQFHMGELTEYVKDRAGGSPDSPSRILRLLRQKGVVGYEVVSRRDSLYRVTEVSS